MKLLDRAIDQFDIHCGVILSELINCFAGEVEPMAMGFQLGHHSCACQVVEPVSTTRMNVQDSLTLGILEEFLLHINQCLIEPGREYPSDGT